MLRVVVCDKTHPENNFSCLSHLDKHLIGWLALCDVLEFCFSRAYICSHVLMKAVLLVLQHFPEHSGDHLVYRYRYICNCTLIDAVHRVRGLHV